MPHLTPSSRNSRVAATTATVLALLALVPFGAQSASAVSGPPPAPLCPPSVQTTGTHIQERLYDSDAYASHVTPSVVAGALPDGASLVDGRWYNDYQAIPTSVGSFDFTLQLSVGRGLTAVTGCHVDVVDDLDLSALTTERIGGQDRYDTSAALSAAQFATADTVYVASGEILADSLSAASVAAARNAPLLLTKTDTLPNAVAAELVRLNPRRIYIFGGIDVISRSVEAQLAAFAPAAPVTRMSGADRFEASSSALMTAARGSDSIFLANGNVSPDPLAGAPAAGLTSALVLTVDGEASRLSNSAKALLDFRNVKRAVIIGGTDSVSSGLEGDVRAIAPHLRRIEGANREDISAALARYEFPASATRHPDTVYLSTGDEFPDSLSGASLAARTGSPVYLAHFDCIPRDAARHILDIGATKVVLLGSITSLDANVANLQVCAA